VSNICQNRKNGYFRFLTFTLKNRGEDKLHPDVFLLREYQKINIF
jgi:hypothetical protein